LNATDDEPLEVPEPRELDREAVGQAVARHREWLTSGGEAGGRADFRRAILRGSDLAAADLRRAWFRGADLTGANLAGSDLTGANLRGANLAGVNLDSARLRDADLQDVDFLGVRGLSGAQIGGANVSGAKLPEAIAKFDGLASIQEGSGGAQTLFTSIMLLCVFTWLTVFGTHDVQLLNSAVASSARLPILGTDIPLLQFYLAVPVLLLFLYVYFLLSLQRVWEELADLPAVFPDGRSLDKKASSWMLNGLVCLHFARLAGSQRVLARWQARMAAAVAWGLVPATLTLLWGRYLRMHDVWATALQVVSVGLAVGAGVGFYRLATATLRAGGTNAPGRQRRWVRALADTRAASGLVALVVVAVLGVFSHGAIEGVNMRLVTRGITRSPAPYWPIDSRVWVPKALGLVGVHAFAAIDESDLSTKPANWSGQEIRLVKGADIGRRDLRFADAYGAFFVNAYLKETDLRGADLRGADLRGANLKFADLRDANLYGAKLQSADLTHCLLDRAVLTRADFRETVLAQASLRGVKAQHADFSNADLTGADLQGADLQGVNLQGAATVAVKMRGADLTGAQIRRDAPGDLLRSLGAKAPTAPLPPPAVLAPASGVPHAR